MRNIILFDDDQWKGLLPLCYTKPIAELRVGILKISEKWASYLNGSVSYITQDYLSHKYPINILNDNLVINSRFLPGEELLSLIKQLKFNDAILLGDTLIAARMNEDQFLKLIDNKEIEELKGVEIKSQENHISFISRPPDIFSLNDQEIRNDYKLLTNKRKSQTIPKQVILSKQVIHSKDSDADIFIEEGAQIYPCYLNSENGPIYIAKDAQIMEGAMIRGPVAIGTKSVVKMGAKIYGATTIGPLSKVGGEINNSVIQGNSNKSHDGFLGNSVIGEWCNIGADSNCSNLKNNYTEVKIWNYHTESFDGTGLNFCGLIMGDHSKAGINTMFNTGTVVGVSCNLFGSGFPRNFVPSFSWGGTKGYITFRIQKCIELAKIVMKRRDYELTDADRHILEHVFQLSAEYRHWEA